MPPVEEMQTEKPASKPLIGIIYPPPEVRNIVDKTASFVARNGPEFESRIRQNEINNPKFNFLNTSDPYYAYYQHKVRDFKEGKGQEPLVAAKAGLGIAPMRPIEQQLPKQIVESILKDPPTEFEFIADPPSISAFDLDVVKLTAQFVARNGRQFLTNLMNREQRNYQFDFLRPQHSLFNYFTKLVEQYTKVLIPPKELLPKMRKAVDQPTSILDEVKYRVEWAKHQERERLKEEEAKEKERVAYAQVDWHDFVVVETVDFQPNEMGSLPPPTTPQEVGARMIQQERFEDTDTVEMDVDSDEDRGRAKDNIQVQDMEESGSDDEDEPVLREQRFPPSGKDIPNAAPPLPPPPPKDSQPPPPLPPMPEQVLIREYDPKSKTFASKVSADNTVVSPFTGEKIPAEKIQEHIRIYLLDPDYIAKVAPDKILSAAAAAKGDEEVFAGGSSIGSSLKQLAERRTDIFGAGTEETQIGKKIGEEEKKDKAGQMGRVIWDGHTASMEKVTQKARENISIEEQIAVIHKVKGLLPDEDKEKIGPKPTLSLDKVIPPVAAVKPPNIIPPVKQPPMMLPPRPPVMVMPPHARMAAPPQPVVGMTPMMPPMGMRAPYAPGPPQHPSMAPKRPGMEDEGSAAKKAKSEDNLVPEKNFLYAHQSKGPVPFTVQVPNMPEKSEWTLNGQSLSFSLPLTDPVSVIKVKVHEAIGMQAGKQKLQLDGMFIKDSNTLAFYNFMPNCVLQLGVKERGARKK